MIRSSNSFFSLRSLLLLLLFVHRSSFAQPASDISEHRASTIPGQMVESEGQVNYRAGQAEAVPALTNQLLRIGDTLHTLTNARATVLFENRSDLRLHELTQLEIVPSATTYAVYQSRGETYVANRGFGTNALRFITPPQNIVKP